MPLALSQEAIPIVKKLLVLVSNRVFPETRKSAASQNATARRFAELGAKVVLRNKMVLRAELSS